MNDYNFKNAKFQYLISNTVDNRFSNNLVLNNNFILNYTESTQVLHHNGEGVGITIVGLCVDAYAEFSRAEIVKYLCKVVNSIQDLTKVIGRFAGKYIIIFQSKEDIYLLGDASTSIPIYYHLEKEKTFSSSENIIASFLDLSNSSVSSKIEKYSDTGIGLPYNISRYKNLYSVLPNHYIDINSSLVKRYSICDESRDESYQFIVNRSIFLINNIVKEYAKYYELICPLTSGYDSRVVLGFLNANTKTECYTFKHKKFEDDSAEIVVPKVICKDLNISYQLLEVKDFPQTLKEDDKLFLSIDQLSSRMDLAYTIKENFDNKAIVSGDIIGQIGKSSLFNNVPLFMANDNYFITKTHSYSEEGRNETLKYLKDLRNNVRLSDMYDFFH